MRILFSGAPAGGHLYAMLPLARAAIAAGDDVVILTGRAGGALVPGYRVWERGPSMADALIATTDRTGDDGTEPGAASMELFGGVRLEGAIADGVIEAVAAFSPNLIVAEAMDEVGPLVASALGVPHVVHAITGPVPADLMAGIARRADAVHNRLGIVRSVRSAFVDPFPRALLADEEREYPADRIAVQPAVHTEAEAVDWARPRQDDKPRVLVSLGTVVSDVDALRALAAAVGRAGGHAVVTTPRDVAPLVAQPADQSWVGFVPLRDLLPHVDVVVTAGGTGTILAALSGGVPMVVRPFLADQFWNAERLAERGVAVAVPPEDDGEQAIRAVLADPTYRQRARRVQREIARTPTAAAVWEQLRPS